MTRDEIDDRLAAAAVRHVHHVELELELQELARHVARRADADGGVVDFVRMRLHEGDEVREALVDAGRGNAFLALDIIRGERVFCVDPDRGDEFELYVMRRAGDLAPFERERRRRLLQP